MKKRGEMVNRYEGKPVWFVPHATLTIVSPEREATALGRGWAS